MLFCCNFIVVFFGCIYIAPYSCTNVLELRRWVWKCMANGRDCKQQRDSPVACTFGRVPQWRGVHASAWRPLQPKPTSFWGWWPERESPLQSPVLELMLIVPHCSSCCWPSPTSIPYSLYFKMAKLTISSCMVTPHSCWHWSSCSLTGTVVPPSVQEKAL